MEKTLLQIQLALFFKGEYNDNFERFSLELKNILGESKNTQHIPVPPNAPGEIPRLILSYDTFGLNVAKNRLDINSNNYDVLKEKVLLIFDIIANKLGLKVGRIGYVKSFFAEGDINKLKGLLKEESVGVLDIKEISLRINAKKTVGEVECNNIEILELGYIQNTEGKKNGLIINRDINTIVEKASEYEFTEEIITSLLDKFEEESKNGILLIS